MESRWNIARCFRTYGGYEKGVQTKIHQKLERL